MILTKKNRKSIYKSINKYSNRAKYLLIACIVLLPFIGNSQITFNRGYIITENFDSISCLIKDVGWDNSPRSFKYKLSKNDSVQVAKIDSVKRFEIFNSAKFIKLKVKHTKDSKTRNSYDNFDITYPDEIFLKVLVEGKASLYLFKNKHFNVFYCNFSGKRLLTLEHEVHYDNFNNTVENNKFREQIANEFNCSEIQSQNINRLNYVEKELVNFFVKYNECIGEKFVDKTFGSNKWKFNLTPRPGVNLSSLSLDFLGLTTLNYLTVKGDKNLRIGLETEFIMPFLKNKWSFIIEPSYSSFQPQLSNNYVEEINLSYFQLQLGVRHYFFLSNKSSIFINVSASYMQDLDSYLLFKSGEKIEINTDLSMAFGIGYRYKRFVFEYNNTLSQNILTNYIAWDTKMTNNSFVIGYSLF